MQGDSIVIVGGGLAGCCAALALSGQFHVTLVDDARSGSASAIGAGLVNPLLGRQAHPVWRMDEALAALDNLVADVGAEHVFSRKPILRAALDAKQVRKYREAAANHPKLATWLNVETCARLYPAATAPLGALRVHGGAIRIPELLDRIVLRLDAAGATVLPEHRLYGWMESAEGVLARITHGPNITALNADYLLLCTGAAAPLHPILADLSVHTVKGQIVETERPPAAEALPNLSADGYAVILDDRVLIGSTWEHAFETSEPTAAATDDLLAKAARLSPLLSNLTIREAQSGVRVTVPRSYLPMVGPLPDHSRVWYFGGLGSKGLLMAPLIASELPGYLAGERAIPSELAIR